MTSAFWSPFRSLCWKLVFLSVLLVGDAAQAVTVPDLYETSQPVADGQRDAAFADALNTVLVRVSGQRDAAMRVGPVSDPRKYVTRFGWTADNVLQVLFDSASVDQLLSKAGLPIWGRERPATVVMFGAEEAGSWRWLAVDTPARERDAIEKVARERGLPLKWPVMDAQERTEASAGSRRILPGNVAPAIRCIRNPSPSSSSGVSS